MTILLFLYFTGKVKQKQKPVIRFASLFKIFFSWKFFRNWLEALCCVQKQSPGGVLKNFRKSIGRHLRQGLFFNKVADLVAFHIKTSHTKTIQEQVFLQKPPVAASVYHEKICLIWTNTGSFIRKLSSNSTFFHLKSLWNFSNNSRYSEFRK